MSYIRSILKIPMLTSILLIHRLHRHDVRGATSESLPHIIRDRRVASCVRGVRPSTENRVKPCESHRKPHVGHANRTVNRTSGYSMGGFAGTPLP